MLLLVVALAGSILREMTGRSVPVGVVFAISLMLFSGLLREWKLNSNKQAKRYSIFFVFAFLLIFPVIAKMTYDLGEGHAMWISYVINYYSGIFLFCVLAFFYKIKSRALIFLGLISYSVYLLHPFFVDVAFLLIGKRGEMNALYFICYVLIVISAASLSYHFIEKKSIEVGRNIVKLMHSKKKYTEFNE